DLWDSSTRPVTFFYLYVYISSVFIPHRHASRRGRRVRRLDRAALQYPPGMKIVRTRLLVAGWIGVLAMAVVSAQSGPTAPPTKPAIAPADAAGQRAIVNQYCVTCHNARLKTANLLLDELDLANLGAHPEIGEKVVRKLRAGLMPPTNNRRPDPATLESLIRGMEGTLDRAAVQHLPAPGLHRLNRTEYTNAIRDLLALEVDATKFLPADDSTRGFDNIAGAL